MRKRDMKYILLLISLFVLYIIVEILSPPPVNWTVTYDENHKIPFGTYALNTLLPDIFEGQEIQYSNNTLYDLRNINSDFKNLIVISNSFSLNEDDEDALIEMLEGGKHIFIASGWFNGKLFDSLKLAVSHSLVKNFAGVRDTSNIFMVEGGPFAVTGPFKYLPNHASLYFYSYDSARAEIFAFDNEKDAILIRYEFGEGALILNTLPMAFTNYYLLKSKNEYFASNALSLLPIGKVHWTNYYQYGRLEPLSKLRFVLTQPPLTWAYYLIISAIVIFMVFESKRRQRAIPVIESPKNSTLYFIGTMGNLYFNKGNNKNIATKKITYFLDYLRQRYFLKTDKLDNEFANKLVMKTGKSFEQTSELISLIKGIEQKKSLNNQELIKLNDKIEDYYFN